jgi:teichuronic acid biosynthesis glycosyltransferase TuaH
VWVSGRAVHEWQAEDTLDKADRPLVVMCAGRPWDGVASTTRMLASALTRYAGVLWIDPPVSPVTRTADRFGTSRLGRPRLRRLEDGVVGFTPIVLPLHTRAGVRHTTPRLVRNQIESALRQIGRRPHAVIDGRLGRLLGGWGDGVTNVLYGTDDFVAGAKLMGRRVEQLEEEERKSLAAADLVLAVSPILQERWRAMGARVCLVPNGVRAESYAAIDDAAPATDVHLPGPVAGVFGQLSERINITILEAVVAEGCSLLLVGPCDPRWEHARFAKLIDSPRVSWLGFRPYESLAGYLRLVDVGLTPYTESEFNRASFPLKTLEYLAAGRAAVSTDLPATQWLDTDLIRVASDPAEFAKATLELAQNPQPELAAARRAFAEQHSWRARAAQVAQALELTTS